MHNLDMNKSLEQIEGVYWRATDYPTGLVRRCYELRKKKLNDLDVSNLRTLISQNIGLGVLLPIAIDFLRKNILAEGDYYPGDLLESVLNRDCSVWKSNKDIWVEMQILFREKSESIEKSDYINNEIKKDIMMSFEKFKSCWPEA